MFTIICLLSQDYVMIPDCGKTSTELTAFPEITYVKNLHTHFQDVICLQHKRLLTYQKAIIHCCASTHVVRKFPFWLRFKFYFVYAKSRETQLWRELLPSVSLFSIASTLTGFKYTRMKINVIHYGEIS